ncbi:hypothetical protein [Variovorax atrisoli]|uniref:hypothetical protein n=1 Tax=Variovorax atrisoli TaxID=3394203 RepID=UPI0033971CCB
MNWIRLAIFAAIGAAVVAAGLTLRAHFIGVGEANVQARWDAQTRVDLEASAQLQRQANADLLIRMKNSERNADEQARLAALRTARDAAAATERSRLLATIEALNRRELPQACDAACVAALAREAAASRELLGSCATRYQSVAAAADELRDQVIGLQADAINVCRASAASLLPDHESQ